jgi:hypothetical protein
MWLSVKDTNPAANRSIVFEFNDTYNLHQVKIWNGNQAGYTDRAMRHITIDCSADLNNWITLYADYELPQAVGNIAYPGVEITLSGTSAKFLRLSAHPITTGTDSGSWGHESQVALSEVEFEVSVPEPSPYAENPVPTYNQPNVDLNVTLGWDSGANALSHDVYLGTNFDDVSNAARIKGDIDGNAIVDIKDLAILLAQWLCNSPETAEIYVDFQENGTIDLSDFSALASNWGQNAQPEFMTNTTLNTFDTATLTPETIYYWRVDEVNGPDTWKGQVWSFTTTAGLFAYCGTGDHLWVAEYEPVDSPNSIDAMFEWMADTYDISRIYWRGGSSQIRSEYWKHGEETLNQYDYVSWVLSLIDDSITESVMASAQKHGMQVFLYTGLFEHGSQPDVGIIAPRVGEDTIRIDHPEWCPLDRWHERRCPGSISFCHPDTRTALVDRLVDQLVRFDYDGVNFYTYVENFGIRYEDEFGFNQPILDEFALKYPDVDLTCDRLRDEHREYWYECRGKFLTEFMSELHVELAQYNKKLSIILDAAEPNYPQTWWSRPLRGTGKIFMDWENWIDDGIVDEIWVQLGATTDQKALLDRLLVKCQGKPIKLTVRTADPLGSTWDSYRAQGVITIAVVTAPSNGIEKYSLQTTSTATLNSPDWKLRLQTLDDITEGLLSASGAQVAPLVYDENVLVRRMAVKALATIGDTSYVSLIEAALNDPEPSVRMAAADRLSILNGPQSVNCIFSALEVDGMFQFRKECADTLGEIATPTDCISRMNAPSQKIREVATQILDRMAMAYPSEINTIYQTLRNTINNMSEAKEVRYWAIDSLIELRYDISIAQIYELINDASLIVTDNNNSPTVQIHASWQIGLLVNNLKYRGQPLDAAAEANVLNTLATLYRQYGGGCTRTDAAYGWRIVGNAIRKYFGTSGTDMLMSFIQGTQNPLTTATANDAISSSYLAKFCANAAGLDESGLLHTNETLNNSWLAHVGSGNPNPGTVPGATWVKIDLGFVYEIDSLWIWNIAHDGYTNRGLRNVTIQYSENGGTSTSDWQTAWTGELNKSLGDNNYAHETEINLPNIEARYIVITSSNTDGSWGLDPCGLAEVRVNTLPEQWLAWISYQVMFNIQEANGLFDIVEEGEDRQNHDNYAPTFPGYRSW